jgi:hypothetical protein
LWSVAAIAPPMEPRPMTAMRRSVLVFMNVLLEKGMCGAVEGAAGQSR